MKKLLLTFILVLTAHSYGQALVASTPLELKKPWDRRQVLASQNSDGTFSAFASDKQKVVCLRYNSALFFRDSLRATTPDENAIMTGASLGDTGASHLYWSSSDFSKVYVSSFDFANRTTSKNVFSFSFENETFIGTYNDDGAFHFLTVDDEKPQLKLRTFRNGNPQEYVFDFAGFDIKDRKGKKLKLVEAFQILGFEFVPKDGFIPLSQASAPIKIYPRNGTVYITLDHDPSVTQIFSISTETRTVKEHKAQQPPLEVVAASRSNSFLLDAVLYQVRISRNEMVVGAKQLDSLSKSVKNYGVSTDGNIAFRTSPLLVQNGNKKPFELSSSKKFFSRLEGARPGISAYSNSQGVILNIGGVREIQDTGNIILGATLGVGAIAAGGGYDFGDMLGQGIVQTIYFESLFDDSFNFTKKDLDPIAVDFLSEFMSQNQSVQNYYLTSFVDAKILTYYDAKQKAVILRKFEDAPPIEEMFRN
ncbi:hypothetical protein [Flavobacterium selenitireducens]|uniref:hypothetical protein n=1 Tax=Flavobacterium selenitireducens TaxID=2722704 RepID=UPI00168B364E|nr:hypothetical protein [Flavobacterium selenitireducens]MBD3581693.1 hypothetical protein [Flavobacterium selenitireducens]